ncbi:ion channel [Providencia sp. PROV212]|uniref:ion channel n=1 Tax=Providencia sp. PROV212 TaxID=2949909 RepID=UPI00234B38EE|nr:ion channel [Providencia sp. PROV212]
MSSIFNHIKEWLSKIIQWNKKKTLPKIKQQISKQISITNVIDDKIELSIITFPNEEKESRGFQIKNKTFENCIFSKSKINRHTFINCSFINCYFNGTEIIESEFHKCKFFECCFFKANFSATYIDPASFYFSFNWHWYWANVNAWFFQSLYRNSKDMHQEKFAMQADKKFQFYKRYEYLRGQKLQLKKFFLSFLYDYTLGYGYGIKNALTVTLMLITGFAFLIQGHLIKGDNDFFQALYFSIVSFTTVGYGDTTPELNMILPMSITMAFLIISMIWFAVVTAIIVKRIVK